MSLDAFINKFGGWTEEYFFYNGEVTLRYDPKAHQYLLVTGDELEPQDGVTSICHIIDKSEALVPWGCKMMAGKLLTEAPVMILPTGDRVVRQMDWQEFENLVLSAKNAHKEKLEDAGEVGHIAHAWIENYIKAVLAKNEPRIEELLAKFPVDERAHNCCLAALDWMRNHNVRWLGTERKIYSRKYKYAGTMDGLCIVDSCSNPLCCPKDFKDRLTIADWKTSNYLYLEYRFQTAAYEQAYEEETGEQVDDRWVIRLGKDDAEFDPWHLEEEQFDADWRGFELALGLSRQVEAVKAIIKAHADRVREAEKSAKQAAREAAEKALREERERVKAEKKAAKEAALKVKCKGADKYQGKRKPSCNGGSPCETCLAKYAEVQASKPPKVKKSRKAKHDQPTSQTEG